MAREGEQSGWSGVRDGGSVSCNGKASPLSSQRATGNSVFLLVSLPATQTGTDATGS